MSRARLQSQTSLLALFATARDPAVTAGRIGGLCVEWRTVCTGVQAVEQTSFTIARTPHGTAATLQGRRTYARTPARAVTAQLVQVQGAGRLVRIQCADGVGGCVAARSPRSGQAAGGGLKATIRAGRCRAAGSPRSLRAAGRSTGRGNPSGGGVGVAPCFGRTAGRAGRAGAVRVGSCEAVWMAAGVRW